MYRSLSAVRKELAEAGLTDAARDPRTVVSAMEVAGVLHTTHGRCVRVITPDMFDTYPLADAFDAPDRLCGHCLPGLFPKFAVYPPASYSDIVWTLVLAHRTARLAERTAANTARRAGAAARALTDVAAYQEVLRHRVVAGADRDELAAHLARALDRLAGALAAVRIALT